MSRSIVKTTLKGFMVTKADNVCAEANGSTMTGNIYSDRAAAEKAAKAMSESNNCAPIAIAEFTYETKAFAGDITKEVEVHEI